MKDEKTAHVIRNMKKQLFSKIIIIVTLVTVGIAAAFYFFPQSMPSFGVSRKTYSNDVYGVTFDYSSRYDISETNKSDEEGGPILVVSLSKDGWVLVEGGEKPPAITMEVFTGLGSPDAKQPPVETWIRNASSSNFHLSANKTIGDTRVGNRPAWLYTWSGLYEGTTVATEHRGNIIVFTVTYDGNNDMQIREDFTILMESVRFYDATPQATTTDVAQ